MGASRQRTVVAGASGGGDYVVHHIDVVFAERRSANIDAAKMWRDDYAEFRNGWQDA